MTFLLLKNLINISNMELTWTKEINMSTFILVIATFVIGMLIIFITLRIGVRMRLSIFWGIVCFSIGTGDYATFFL